MHVKSILSPMKMYKYVTKIIEFNNIGTFSLFSLCDHCGGNQLLGWSINSSSEKTELGRILLECLWKHEGC